ncbi:hypothetical protein CALVIDRAFT_315233 [Calocera viscosa TUFC12733]|uniref:F-box domain-containing protein n=1 Tax=Calocera viscosa (strain TUFC12733) TaxID=1330018 RepID=A0A167I0M8_CALVF|nr:hypothetical protein CALVIDRAFT_315233 [Calocera viscosa TUFC12733]
MAGDCGERRARPCPPKSRPHSSPSDYSMASVNAPFQFSGVGSRVPDDIWNLVFRLLHSSRTSVTNVSLCCRRFHALTSPLLFQRLHFHHSRLENTRALCRLVRARSAIRVYVQEVDIDWIAWSDHRMVAGAPPRCIRQLLYGLPNLEMLSLSGAVISSEGAMLLATRPNIRNLSISSSCRLSPDLHRDLPGTKNSGLESLTIGKMEYDNPEDLVAWLHLLLGPDLRNLHVLGGLGTERYFIGCLLQELVPGSLRRLHIEHVDGSLLYEIIAQQPRLEDLHFYCSEPLPAIDSRLPGSAIDTVRFWMQHRTDKSKQLTYEELMPMYHNAIKLARRPLRSLELRHIDWDQCVFDVLPSLFPSLERFAVFFLDRPDMVR